MRSPELPILPSTGHGQAARPTGWPLLRLGFRPFYFAAAAFAAIGVPLWLALMFGQIELRMPIAPIWWHAHEMVFGFAVAVIVGFLLTAGQAWTGLATPRGALLGTLAGLWLAARLAAIVAPHAVFAVLDLLLLPLVAAIFATVLLRAGNRRNLPLVAILMLLSFANLAFHLAAAGIVEMAPSRALYAGLGLIVMIECVIAGRVIPAFTVNATPGLKLRSSAALERASLAVTAMALAAWVFGAPAMLTAIAFALAAAAHLWRMARWQPWLTRGRPILWILHLAYAWLPVGFALLAASQIGPIAASAGIHALAVGATGGLIIGMMTRTARGHTGRPLRASGPEIAAYLLVMAAAVLRVFTPLVAPHWTTASLLLAAAAWSAAFIIYLAIFGPWLLSTRADGKDG